MQNNTTNMYTIRHTHIRPDNTEHPGKIALEDKVLMCAFSSHYSTKVHMAQRNFDSRISRESSSVVARKVLLDLVHETLLFSMAAAGAIGSMSPFSAGHAIVLLLPVGSTRRCRLVLLAVLVAAGELLLDLLL